MKNVMKHFLGEKAPVWYKKTILFFLIFNVISLLLFGPTITAWLFIGEFIFTLAMALKCYPLQSGGLLAIQAIVLKLTTAKAAFHEIDQNLEVVLLLVFMVAGIFFMKPLLMFLFTKIFTQIRSKLALSLLFVSLSAVLSAFLDALTVTAVLISVATGFYFVYTKVKDSDSDFDLDGQTDSLQMEGDSLVRFKSFLRSLMMHGLVGTALGGVCTLVGEPQNLLIGEKMGWDFIEFFLRMAPVTIPVFVAGLLVAVVLEKAKIAGYGETLPYDVRLILEGYAKKEDENRTASDRYKLSVQAVAAVLLVLGLATHAAPVGLIGLGIIVFQTVFMGITEEHHLGKAFEEALPFTGLLAIFFVIVAMIHDQHLFSPIIHWALSLDADSQPLMFYIANGVLSMISDNVFVATVYIGEVKTAYDAGQISLEQFETLAVAINTGTNLPSVATPNGQAAFLFLLTSPLAPLIGLSYGKMVKMALPYTIVLGVLGALGVMFFL